MQVKQRRTGTRRRRDVVSGRRIALTMLLIVSLLLSNVTTIVSPAAVWAADDSPTTPAATPDPDPTPDPQPTPQNTPAPEPTATVEPQATPTATTAPKPTATTAPEPTATTAPEPTATTAPEPTATTAPEPTATTMPEPTATTAPEPTATTVPEPTATTAPEPSPTATAAPQATPQATVEPEPTPTATTAPQATPSATVEPQATPQATVEPEPTPTATTAPQITPSATAAPQATATTAPETTPQADLVPSFSLAVSGFWFQAGEEITETTLPAADSGNGKLTYSLSPDLPEGLSFDPDTRTLTGTPAEGGEYTMTYTANDEDGDEASFDFTITVQPALVRAQQNLKILPTVRNLTVTRTRSDKPMNPAIDVTWDAPNLSGDRATLSVVEYEVRYLRKGYGVQKSGIIVGKDDRSTTLTDLLAGTSYRVDVRVRFANTAGWDADPNGWDLDWAISNNITTNRPPNTTNVAIVDGSFPVGDFVVSPTPMSTYFGDADGDTLTYSSSSNYRGVAYTYLEGDPLKLWARAINPSTATITYGASDPYGGYASRTWKLTGVANWTRSVDENSPAGTAVGAPVVGSSYEGGNQTYTYTFTGEAVTSGAFEINSSTGQISVKQGATLDYETKSSYTGTVTWTVQEQTATANLTINVTDLEAGKPAAPTVTRAAFSEPTNPALDVSWTVPDDNGDLVTWYEVQYRKQAAAGQNPADWTLYSERVLQKKDTSLRLANLEAGAIYEFQVRAGINHEGTGPWSDTGTGRANRPPTGPSPALAARGMYSGGEVRYETLRWMFSDTDSDTLTYYATAEHPGVLEASVSSDLWLVIDAHNPSSTTVTYGVHDGYGGYASGTVTLAPRAFPTRSIAERSPAGTAVGDPVTGTPYDDGDDQTDDALTYTLTGEAATSGAFEIDSATGQIKVKQGASLDYETKSSYTGQVNWTVQGQAAAAELTINVTDIEPGQPGTPTVTRTAFSQQSNPALDVTWTAAAANGLTISGYNVQYRKKAADGETPAAWTTYTYTDSSDNETSTLSATTTSINLPDLEAGATYEVQVRAVTSEEEDGPWSDTGEGQANRPPVRHHYVLDSDIDRVVGKYGLSGNIIPVMNEMFVDPESDALTFAYASSNTAIMSLWSVQEDGNTRFKYHLKHPTVGRTTITLSARDGYGGFTFLRLHVRGTRSETWYVNENANARTVVGRLFGRNPSRPQADAGSLTLTGFPAGLWTIDADRTGQVRVARGASLDYETTNSYTGKMEYTAGGTDAVVSITIHVVDLEAGKPGTPTVTRTAFSEQSAPALDVAWTAAAANGTSITGYEAQYRKKAAQGEEAAEWTAYSGTLSATATSLNLTNLEAGATYEVQVRAVTSDEGEGPWSDIGEGQANTPPTTNGADLADSSIAVGVATDYDVSDKFTDADSDTLTYSASAAQAGVLTAAITGSDADTLTVTALNPAASVVTYGVSDGYGGYVSRTVTITGTAAATRSVAENAAAGTAVGDPVTGTPYNGATLTYTLAGAAAGAFTINSASGQISVKTGASLDYETTSSYTGTVTYTVQGQTATVNLTVNVTDVEPGQPGTPTITRTQFSGESNPALDVTWTAAAANGLTISGYNVQYRKKAADGARHPPRGRSYTYDRLQRQPRQTNQHCCPRRRPA